MQRPQPTPVIGPLIVFAIVAGCGSTEIDPDALPWRMEMERVLQHNSRAVDLDGDGRDEIYFAYPPFGAPVRPDHEALVLESQTTGIIDQANFAGRVLDPHFLDIDEDSRLEALVPVLRNDSLFLSVVGPDGDKQLGFFLASGRPRVEPEGVIAWDPLVRAFAVHDFDGDGANELITVLVSAYARLPRGVYVHRLPGGEQVGEIVVGAALTKAVIRDFDGDGHPEVFAVAAATNNGARAGGLDDSRAYALVFDTWPVPSLRMVRQMPATAAFPTFVTYDDDGDGRDEILLMARGSSGGLLELLDTRTWRPLRSRTLDTPIGDPGAVDLDRDGLLEVVVPAAPDRVLLFDHRFDLRASARFDELPWMVDILPDLDGDGIDEIAVGWGGPAPYSGFVMLDGDLKVKAQHAPGWPVGVLRRGGSNLPGLIVHEGTREHEPERAVLFALVPNRFYLVHRYGRALGWTAAGLGLLIVGVGSVRLGRRKRVLELVAAGAADGDRTGILLLDRTGRIRWSNRTVARWFALDGERPADLAALEVRAGERGRGLARFWGQALRTDPPQSVRSDRALPAGPDGPAVNAVAEPVIAGLRGDPHWLLRLDDATAGPGLGAEWEPLARRLMHDVRNPLTSMLLTLQRLQMEYRERVPEAAPMLDTYVKRLQDRADQLRRMTSGFLKLVGAEHGPLDELDPNDLVRGSAEAIARCLPPDVAIELRLSEPLTRISADREQLESVLENLVANAVHAMPDGGTITLATGLARGLRIGRGGPATDCVQIDVLDTGGGIPADVIDRMFEPGFSTREGGSGLGLAIVRRIVAGHGGELHVESEPGVGSAFTLLLPVRPPDRESYHA